MPKTQNHSEGLNTTNGKGSSHHTGMLFHNSTLEKFSGFSSANSLVLTLVAKSQSKTTIGVLAAAYFLPNLL